MDYLKKFNFDFPKILKITGIVIAGIFILSLVFQLFGSSFRTFTNQAPGNILTDNLKGFGGGGGEYSEEMAYDAVGASPASQRDITSLPEPPRDGGSVGSDAEDFEVTQYSASIETRDLETVCGRIADLKSLEYVIFENAQEHDNRCNYTFKVERERAGEILVIIEELNPKDLTESTYTIKRTIENIISEQEILEKKLETINDTLESAIQAYDNITNIASRNNDVESLAKIIDSKINILERLTRERINVSTQLDRLSKSKAEQLDRLEYAYFYVTVFENKFIDGENLKDSWKNAVQQAVLNINRAVQDVTVNLLAFLFIIFQYILYILILVFVAKYGWKVVKGIWQK